MEYSQEAYTKHYIVQALFMLMEEYVYEKINVTDIVKKAGVGRATFYRYFKSKEDVILFYFESIKKDFEFNQHLYPRCREDYVKVVTEVLSWFEKNKQKLKSLHRAHLDYIYLGYLNENYIIMFNADYPESTRYLPYIYAGMLYNVSMAWLKNDCEEPPEALAKTIVDAIYTK